MEGNKKKVLEILADIFYSQATLTWDQFKSKALFLNENYKLGPKGTKEVAGCLYGMFIIIKEKYEAGSNLMFDEKGNCLSLADMTCYGHGKFFDEVAKRFSKIPNYIKDLSPIDSHIDSLCIRFLIELACVDDCKIYEEIQRILGYDIRSYIVPNAKDDWEHINLPYEDKYRFAKASKLYLNMYKKANFFIGSIDVFQDVTISEDRKEYLKKCILDKAYSAMGRLEALKDMTISEDRKEYLENCISGIKTSLYFGDISLIDYVTNDSEELFIRSVKR